MIVRAIAGLATVVAASIVLVGCSAGTAAPTPTPTPTPTFAAAAGCPDITASDFALNIPTTPVDPVAQAKTVGLADVLDGTCAYGFESDQVDGVAFFIVGASDETAGTFYATALKYALAAGFTFSDSQNQGTSMVIPGSREDGAAFLIGYNSDVEPNDAEYTPERLAAIGVKPGQSLLFGSIQLP